ncbi:MAG: hypothetical protein AMK72_05115 [Planctomycetes bacterium SM23_25]|nr:MAG: hypothetical protein AMK72_05115 [Planctomycetes bacterium SM23_25]
MLIYFQDARPADPHYEALQFFALRGFLGRSSWEARLDEVASDEDARQWIAWAGAGVPQDYAPGRTTRGRLLDALYASILEFPPEKVRPIRADP